AGNDFLSRKCSEGERLDEFLSRFGHNDLNPDSAFLQQTNNLCRFVRCNSAGDAECDFHKLLIDDLQLSIENGCCQSAIGKLKISIPVPALCRASRSRLRQPTWEFQELPISLCRP